jgi:ABC-type uncharacterized transport system permease subunit
MVARQGGHLVLRVVLLVVVIAGLVLGLAGVAEAAPDQQATALPCYVVNLPPYQVRLCP